MRAAAICSQEVASQVQKEPRSLFHTFHAAPASTSLEFAKARWLARRLEDEFNPDVVYTIFGPSYWLPKAPHVIGFAIPALLYGRIESRLYPSGNESYIDYASWRDILR